MCSGLQWKRPLNESYPNVWTEFTARESKNSDKLVKYRIQDLSGEYFNGAIDHMMKYFLADQPNTESSGMRMSRPETALQSKYRF